MRTTIQIKTSEVRVGDRTAFGDEIIWTERSGDKLLVRIKSANTGKIRLTDWNWRGTVFSKERTNETA